MGSSDRSRISPRSYRGLIGPREPAVVHNVDARHVIRKRRQQPFQNSGDFFRCSIFPQGNIRRVFDEEVFIRFSSLRSPLSNTVHIPRRQRAAQRQGVDMNAARTKRKSQCLGLPDPSATNDIRACIVAQNLRRTNASYHSNFAALALRKFRCHPTNGSLEHGQRPDETGFEERVPLLVWWHRFRRAVRLRHHEHAPV